MTIQRIADDLLWPCWRGMRDDYKQKYARNIWDQFVDNIRNAAYTPSLAKFFDNFCLRLDIAIRSEDVALVNAVLADPDGRAILRSLREETTALVLVVRIRNQERKEKLEAARKADAL